MTFKFQWIRWGFFFLCGLALSAVSAQGARTTADRGILLGSHGNSEAMPRGCQACHRGMSMKVFGEEALCLSCHGGQPARDQMISGGYLEPDGAGPLADIGYELSKPYHHPVVSTKGVHHQGETLPEEVVRSARHSECVDCHHPHKADKDKPFRGMLGKRVGNFIVDVGQEYELCYRCHAESANLPSSSTNKYAEFKITNQSFHPVEGEGRSTYVISLLEPYVARKEKPGDVSLITCSDCHGSDSPEGPRGPHGSNYRGLLVLNYQMEDGRSESAFAYALCYKCHNRDSILGNESFPYHSLHIEGSAARGNPGTSCFTCHDAHGSSANPALLRFDEEVVSPPATGKLKYVPQGVGARHGSCYLNCHGVEHAPLSY